MNARTLGGSGGGVRRTSPLGRSAAGFTLIELLIVVAVIGILAAIAYPSYREQITRSRRASGAACLLEAAQFMERYYTTRMTYVGANPVLGCATSIATTYSFPAPGVATATAFTLTAVPEGGHASADTKCGTLGIDQAGVKTVTGTASAASECW